MAASLPDLAGGSAQASPLGLYGVGLRGPARCRQHRRCATPTLQPAGLMDLAIEFAVTHQINAGRRRGAGSPGAPLAPAA